MDIGDGGLIVNAPWLVHGVIQIEHPDPGAGSSVSATGDITLSPLGRLRTRDTADILNNAPIQGEVACIHRPCTLPAVGPVRGYR
ncbi:MAG: hypothetical protein R3C45_10900 [Phycisphaerales bacterium]